MALDFGLSSYDPRKATAADFTVGTSYPVYDDAIMRQARINGQITYNPYAKTTATAPAPTLSFPGAPEVGVNPYRMPDAPTLTYGKPSVLDSVSGVFSSVFGKASDFVVGQPASGGAIYDDAIMRAGRASGQTTYNPNIPGSGMYGPQPTPIVTGQVDGQAGWIDGLKTALGGVMDYIGSQGDGQAQVTPVAMQSGGETNWPLILLAVGGAAAVYYAATR